MQLLHFALLLIFANTVRGQSSDCSKLIGSLLLTPAGTISIEKKNYVKNCIYEIQNAGFLLDEQQCKYTSAKIKIEEALKIWLHINDTLNQANLIKYLAYLNGRLGNYEIGKSQIKEAIRLYSQKKDESGIAVSYFNLGRIYQFENKIDSAIFFIEKASLFWKQQNNPARIVIYNNHLINLYLRKKLLKRIKTLITENKANSAKGIYWQEEIDFYFLTAKYFNDIGDKNNSKKYQQLYSSRKEILEKETGSSIFSLFDKQKCQ